MSEAQVMFPLASGFGPVGALARRPAVGGTSRQLRWESRLADLLAANDGRWLVPTLSGLAVADGLAAAFDLSLPN